MSPTIHNISFGGLICCIFFILVCILWSQVHIMSHCQIQPVMTRSERSSTDATAQDKPKRMQPEVRRPLHLKRILLWTGFWDHADWYFGVGRKPFLDRKCPVSECETITDRSMYNYSDAVLFHIRNMKNMGDFPKTRSTFHHWIFFTMEPPHNTFMTEPFMDDMGKLNGKFNATMTYRRDSDIPTPYGYIKPLPTPRPINVSALASKKTKLVAWVTSNCVTTSKRERYVRELQKYIKVNVFGKCGQKICQGMGCPELKGILSEHRFYLAFENAICKDYASEKIWRALQDGVVPVVLGGADYKSILPPNSYIDIKDFSSPQDLAKFLHKLSQPDNAVLYNSYFTWRQSYKVVFHNPNSFCDLCAYLHKPEAQKRQSKTDLGKWWNENHSCMDPITYYGKIMDHDTLMKSQDNGIFSESIPLDNATKAVNITLDNTTKIVNKSNISVISSKQSKVKKIPTKVNQVHHVSKVNASQEFAKQNGSQQVNVNSSSLLSVPTKPSTAVGLNASDGTDGGYLSKQPKNGGNPNSSNVSDDIYGRSLSKHPKNRENINEANASSETTTLEHQTINNVSGVAEMKEMKSSNGGLHPKSYEHQGKQSGAKTNSRENKTANLLTTLISKKVVLSKPSTGKPHSKLASSSEKPQITDSPKELKIQNEMFKNIKITKQKHSMRLQFKQQDKGFKFVQNGKNNRKERGRESLQGGNVVQMVGNIEKKPTTIRKEINTGVNIDTKDIDRKRGN